MTDAVTPTALDDHQKDVIRQNLVSAATKLIGVPYLLGAEWTNYAVMPEALDCSEMVEGVYHLNGLKSMPDGSQNQHDFCVHAPSPKPGDLFFLARGGNEKQVYHVGMVFDETNIIEARGFQPGSSFETGKVILRGRVHWEQYLPNFLGYFAHPKLL